MIQYVFYDDTDCGGIVYHARYLVFCERARSLFFFEKGMLPQNTQYGFVVQHIESHFVKTLQLGDMYQVQTIPIEIKSASVTLKQDVYKIGALNIKSHKKELVFTMQVRLAHIDLQAKKPCKITNSLQDVMAFFTDI